MSEPLTIAVPCFGPSPKWTKMLLVWLTHYLNSGCRLPVVVITDMTTAIPMHEFPPVNATCLRFDPLAFPAIIRPGMAFDLHGSLICHAARFLGPCVVMDTDCLLLRDPTEAFARFPSGATLGMAPDCGSRKVRVLEGDVPERNGGVLYFGEATPNERERLVWEYHNVFAELMLSCASDPILEQLVWSVVWHRLAYDGKAHDIPRALNHSHRWGMNPGVIIRHEHGSVKWHRVEGEITHA